MTLSYWKNLHLLSFAIRMRCAHTHTHKLFHSHTYNINHVHIQCCDYFWKMSVLRWHWNQSENVYFQYWVVKIKMSISAPGTISTHTQEKQISGSRMRRARVCIYISCDLFCFDRSDQNAFRISGSLTRSIELFRQRLQNTNQSQQKSSFFGFKIWDSGKKGDRILTRNSAKSTESRYVCVFFRCQLIHKKHKTRQTPILPTTTKNSWNKQIKNFCLWHSKWNTKFKMQNKLDAVLEHVSSGNHKVNRTQLPKQLETSIANLLGIIC